MANTNHIIRYPSPRRDPGPFIRQPLPVKATMPLPPPSSMSMSIRAVLARRRSAEVFAKMDQRDLSTWLYYTAAMSAVNHADSNRERRFVPSFGALHPAHLLLCQSTSWYVYHSRTHTLGRLEVKEVIAKQLGEFVADIYPADDATLIALLSDVDLAEHYYNDPEELLLRDAGVLLGHGALVASALGLSYRILGATGAPLVEQLIIGMPFNSMATGLALIGGERSCECE